MSARKLTVSARTLTVALILVLGVVVPATAWAQDPVPPTESIEKAFPEETKFSPYAGRNFPTQVFWGDTHLHTGMSMDAGAFGARPMCFLGRWWGSSTP